MTKCITLLVYAAFLCPLIYGFGQSFPTTPKHEPQFVGSESCKGCHAQAYKG